MIIIELVIGYQNKNVKNVQGIKKHLYQLLDEAISYRKLGPRPGWTMFMFNNGHNVKEHNISQTNSKKINVKRRQDLVTGNGADQNTKHPLVKDANLERSIHGHYFHLPPQHEFHHHHHHHNNKHQHGHDHKNTHKNEHTHQETYVHVHKHKHKHKHDHFHDHDAVVTHKHDNKHEHKHQNEHIEYEANPQWRRRLES